jgi:hypothetical protein
MFFILRLTNGDCVVTTALGQDQARKNAASVCADEATEVASVRLLPEFTLQFSPTDEGSLEVKRWHEATLDGILANEYPLLEEAYHRANAEPFTKLPDHEKPNLEHLKAANERNREIIRTGLELELQRFGKEGNSLPKSPPAHKTAGAPGTGRK